MHQYRALSLLTHVGTVEATVGRTRMKLGFLSMPVTGHLNPMTALARKL
jgi:hypothetical protein